jgi:hypothetical protein
MTLRPTGLFKWAGVLLFVFCMAWLANWNEHDSPWGREIQQAKMERLKERMCR